MTLAISFLDYQGLQAFFLICAFIGGVFFVARLAMMLMGFGHDVDAAHDVATAHDTTDSSFKGLSLQGITSFFMMFGLVGFAVLHGGFDAWIAVASAIAAGVGTVAIQYKIMISMKKLESSGNIDPAKTVGARGAVYLTIPAGGTGKVQVVVVEQLKEFDAVSKDKKEIRTGEQIRVVEATDGPLLVVEKV